MSVITSEMHKITEKIAVCVEYRQYKLLCEQWNVLYATQQWMLKTGYR